MIPKREIITVMSGDFDPPTDGDIKKMKYAKSLGDWLIVGVHSDLRVSAKNGEVHFPLEHRSFLVKNMKYVDEVFHYEGKFNDDRGLLMLIKTCYPGARYIYLSSDASGDSPESQITGVTFTSFQSEN